jgi:hypothetical protein
MEIGNYRHPQIFQPPNNDFGSLQKKTEPNPTTQTATVNVFAHRDRILQLLEV